MGFKLYNILLDRLIGYYEVEYRRYKKKVRNMCINVSMVQSQRIKILFIYII